MAWVSTSMPVSAVMRGGRPITSVESTMARSGSSSGVPSESFICRSVSVSTVAQVASEPVPEVVGIAISRAFWRRPYCSMGLMTAISASGHS